MVDLASQMHHIFPVSDYPAISDSLENLIALTPSQHYINAHPNNNTKYINREYQYICLVSKTGTIKDNLMDDKLQTIYNFDAFKYVLNIGLETDKFENIVSNDFNTILQTLDLFY